MGASINAAAPWGSETTTFTASGLSDNAGQWIALANDVLLNPSFPAGELDKLKQRMRVQLRQQRSSPNFLMQERFDRAVYGKHPAAITSPTRRVFGQDHSGNAGAMAPTKYLPENAILGIAGDIRPEDVKRLFSALSGWKEGSGQAALPAATTPAVGRKVFLVDRPGSVQTDVALGNIAVSRLDPNYIPMVVMDRHRRWRRFRAPVPQSA